MSGFPICTPLRALFVNQETAPRPYLFEAIALLDMSDHQRCTKQSSTRMLTGWAGLKSAKSLTVNGICRESEGDLPVCECLPVR